MREMPNLLEADDIETIGASVISEFTWKHLLDTDACTMCGRCTSVCPANVTGKPLDPREIVLKLGEVAARSGQPAVSAPVSIDDEITVTSDSVFERITSEELWACTSCRACDEICPVNIEILDKILDMRRYLSLMEADFPPELVGQAPTSRLENSSNPYGMASERPRRTGPKELDFDGAAAGSTRDVDTAEYLYWVGCAGSFDDRNREGNCRHGPAASRGRRGLRHPRPQRSSAPVIRRGAQATSTCSSSLALQNIETLNDLGVTKVDHPVPALFQHPQATSIRNLEATTR